MDRVKKFLRKLSPKEQEAFLLLMQAIKRDFTSVPHLLKMKGYNDLYRIRFGRYRIIFKVSGREIDVVKISKRDEQTYKNIFWKK